MADERTDAEANEQDNDGMPLFTAQTETPRRSADNFISEADEALSRRLVDMMGHAYRDMRGNWWVVKWSGKAWTAYPTKATAATYNAQYGTKMDPKRMYAAATDAPGMISAIDERIEAARVEAANRGQGWLVLLILGGLLLLGDKR